MFWKKSIEKLKGALAKTRKVLNTDIRELFKIGRKIEWDAIISGLCEYISDKQDFKAPKILFDNYSADVDIMVSEGVLTSDSRYYGFFHGSFFDYAFARIFVSNCGNVKN